MDKIGKYSGTRTIQLSPTLTYRECPPHGILKNKLEKVSVFQREVVPMKVAQNSEGPLRATNKSRRAFT